MSTFTHQPVVSPLTIPSVWGVCCDACSHEAEDYVYPCALQPDGAGWPPARLIDVQTTDDARRETATAQAAIDRVMALCDEVEQGRRPAVRRWVVVGDIRRALGVEADTVTGLADARSMRTAPNHKADRDGLGPVEAVADRRTGHPGPLGVEADPNG